MEIIQAIENRRSIRKYRIDFPVEKEKIGAILEAATHAPNAGNIQDWRFIIVRNPEKRQQIAEACFQQYWMGNAPVHIIVCSPQDKTSQFYGVRGEKLYSIQNCASAITNLLLAAYSLGLGSCWVGAFEEEMIRKSTGIPSDVRVQAVVTIGYPDERPEKKRLYHLRDVTFVENWGSKMEDAAVVLGNYHVLLGKTIERTKKATASLKERISKKLRKKK